MERGPRPERVTRGWPIWCVFLTTVMLIPLAVAVGQPGGNPRVDPDTGRVRILYVGDGWGRSPVPYYESDPAFTVVSVPASEFHLGQVTMHFDMMTMKKFVRLYMPRTYERMIREYDLVILSDANAALIDTKYQNWMKDSLRKEGVGLLMVGGLESFGGPRAQPWTYMEDSLPVSLIQGEWLYESFKIRPALDDPFTRSLPWSTMPFFLGMNRVTLKQGAVLLMTSKRVPYPPLSYMEVEGGRTVAHAMDWSRGGGTDITIWKYFGDYVANLAYLATRCEIPEDVEVLHELRADFFSVGLRIGSVTDTINFAERFGARTVKIQRRLGGVRDSLRDAERLYIDHDYQEARQRVADIDKEVLKLQQEAVKLKDRALFWIYLVEWAFTSAVALLSGLLLWSLMVRRRLYREVSLTRIAREE